MKVKQMMKLRGTIWVDAGEQPQTVTPCVPEV
jgi:hypothetical protein